MASRKEKPARLKLRDRFVVACGLLVLTTVVASIWTFVVLARLSTTMGSIVRGSEEIASVTARLTTALEREDDAFLLVGGGDPLGPHALQEARTDVDAARQRLHELVTAPPDQRLIEDVDLRILAYRASVDTLMAKPQGDLFLENYHREANPLLRQSVASVGRIRDRHFDQTRQAGAHARGEISRTKGVVLAISVLAIAVAVGVALTLTRSVISPLRQFEEGADAIREGDFDTRIRVAPGDEIAEVADAFNHMAERLAEFRRFNLDEVIRAKRTLEAVLAALPDAVLLVDAGGHVVAVNPSAERLLRQNGRDLPKDLDDLERSGIERAKVMDALAGSRGEGAVTLAAALRWNAGGEERRVLPRMARAVGGRDAKDAVVLVLSDVTELARLDEMRAEHVAVTSHELRTPVTTLKMALLLLKEKRETLPEEARVLLDASLVTSIGLHPYSTWPAGMTKQDLIDRLSRRYDRIPGATVGFSQPMIDGVNDKIAGAHSELVIKVFGRDFAEMRRIATQITDVLRSIVGAVDVAIDQEPPLPQLQIAVDREAAARVGVNVADISDLIEIGIGGRPVGQLFQGERRYDITTRFVESVRNSEEAIGNLTLSTPGGARIPLSQVAMIEFRTGESTITREANRRHLTVKLNLRGRDLSSFLQEARDRHHADGKKLLEPPCETRP